MPSIAPAIGQHVPFEKITLGTFESEKYLERYVTENIAFIMATVFGERVTSYQAQKSAGTRVTKILKNQLIETRRGPRVDLYVECASGNNYLIEIKNPNYKGSYDTARAVGQLLHYSVIFPKANKFVILSTRYDTGLSQVIQRYKLPIEFVLFAKTGIYLLKNYGNN